MACFTLLLLTPQTMHADVVYRGSLEVEYDKTTTVTLPDFLIAEYNNHGSTPYGGGGTLSWSVSNSSLIIELTWNFSCRIRPRSGSVFPSYVTLTAQFYSWYGTTFKTTQAEWTVRLKEKAPDPIPVTSISLSPSSTSLKVGKQIQISATVSPNNATDKSVSWSTSNSSVATVNSSGWVTAEGVGTATITCKANDGSGVSNTCSIAVDPIFVTNIALDVTSASLLVGETQQLTATVSPNNATDNSISWSSSNNSVASVSSNGLVTAKGAGTATITCRANDGSGVQATCNVTVPEPVTISINSTNFPDDNFRNYLLEQDYGKDGVLTGLEIKNITYISVSDENISSLNGIEYFTALISLSCYHNQLTALDVSKNTVLTYLSCYNNQLTVLDVSKNTALKELWCSNNQLTALDVSNNTALTCLRCDFNQLTVLDVSKNTALEWLDCYFNDLTTLNLSKNTALTRLRCSLNFLTALDVSKNTELTNFECYGNNLKENSMDALIKSLPNNISGEEHYFRGFSDKKFYTKTQVAAIKDKGWIPQYINGTEWVEYEGSEDTSIATKISLPVSQTVNVGSTLQLTPTIEPATAEATLTWTTDDATIAKVTSTGVVFGSKEGTAIITVTTDNGLKAECFVMVQLSSGISSVGADSEDAPVYTLSGQRLAAPRKGLNIRGGKMIVVK